VIIDTLSQGLEIDMSSFEITEAGMDFDDYFELTIEVKTLITEPTVVVMTAKNTAVINDTFTIIYSADIDEDEVIGKKVSNSIELTGDRVNVGITSDTVEEDFTSISGFGTGTGEVGSFTLTKVDKDDNTIKLEGAEYELKRGTKVLGTLTTDSDGEITVGNLLYLGHTLTETKAPDGYILDTTPYDFTIDSATKTFTLENEMLRTLNIKKVDSSNASKVLSGARFEVYDSGDVLVSTLTTDNLGYANIVLDLGDYSIKEVKAPSGYYLNSVEQLITIDISSDSFEVIFENRRKPSGSTFVPTPPEEPEPEPEPEPEVVLEPIPEPEEEKVVKKTTEEVPTGGEIEVPEGTEPKVSTPPTNGTVEIDDTGKWTYTPNPDFEGEDAFTITVEQPDGSEEIIYFEIEVEETPLGFVKLPQTGKSIPWANYIGGLFVMLIGVVLLKKRR
jgi:LPXTG-motif cell wall-anchored protein